MLDIKQLILCGLLILGILLPIQTNAIEPVSPIPIDISVEAGKARLGEKLFFETRLSSNNQVSCASCHNIETKAGTDLLSKPAKATGQKKLRNTPTVYNAVLNLSYNWDGSSYNLRDQVEKTLVKNDEEKEISFTFQEMIKKLKALPEYKSAFDRDYNGEISRHSITHALAEFQKTLVTPNSPFDKFLKGNESAISDDAKEGYKKFKQYGCSSCHQGANVGGNLYQKFGIHKDTSLRNIKDNDLGRYVVTGDNDDKRVFKVPSLRLAVLTPPYFHDGSVNTIEEAVDVMIYYQLGRQVSIKDRNQIIAFLKTLPGDLFRGDK